MSRRLRRARTRSEHRVVQRHPRGRHRRGLRTGRSQTQITEIANHNLIFQKNSNEYSDQIHDGRGGREGHQIGRSCPSERRRFGTAVPHQSDVRTRRGRRIEECSRASPPHRGSGALRRPQVRGCFPARLALRGRQRPQGDAERPCRLHSDLPERDPETLPFGCRSLQRGDDPGLPARQARLRVARHVGRRHAGGHRVRRPRDRRGSTNTCRGRSARP